ncbi:hypothetical protein [Myxococcus xanthus]|uniref:hypothetical protein n=1 Tax=Myxococcus xanthus TaxID=34 RepID=UPI001127CC00|nr:hypothetical protein [Myxococcus xanthus]QDF05028.1 hypothetical protein BHS04_17720 [Myxococcus xanthus]
MPTHDKRKTRPERRKAAAGSTVRLEGLHISHAAWARLEALVAQLGRAGIPRAHRSGALDMLVLHPEVAAMVLAGGCRVSWCATCAAWLPTARDALTHQDAQPEHVVQGFLVPPA